MPDNDYNIIKPVESLENITGLTPAKRREERKRRQNMHREKRKKSDQKPNGLADQQNTGGEFAKDENEQHSIDYCA
jgi:hypothetical protein